MTERTQRRRAAEACGVLDQAMSGKDEHRPQDVFWWAQRGQNFRRTYGDVSAARDRGNDKKRQDNLLLHSGGGRR